MLLLKKLFMEAKSGKLDIPQAELENHLKMTYSDNMRDIPIPLIKDLPRPQDPTVMFDDSVIMILSERHALVVPLE